MAVESSYGTPTGEGWYDAGSEAAITVEPAVPMEGLLGTLGARWVFSQWTGDFTSTSPSATVPMDKPAHVQALWAEDYSIVYLDAVAIVGLLATLFLLSRKEIWERIIAWLKSQFST
ncbi:MAG: hypothetical protein GTN71_10160 [Anaerolineae bacterium]|nr:hypothetical protein [Anaerolineae bacterium]